VVICVRCDGRGWRTHRYKEFKKRKRLPWVTQINLSRGSFIATGVGGHGAPMTYEEFERK